MDIVEFAEQGLGLKLYDYQKKMLRYIQEHPEIVKGHAVLSREGRLYMLYEKEILKNEQIPN